MIRTGAGPDLAAPIPQKVSPPASQPAQATPVAGVQPPVAVAAQAPPVVAAPPSPAVVAEVAAAVTAPDTAPIGAAPIDAAPAPATLPPEPKAVAGRRTATTAASGIAGPNARAAAEPDPALSPVEVAEAASDETGHEPAPAEPALDGPEPATTRIDGQAQTLAGRADSVAGAPAPSAAQARVTPETVTRLAVGIIDKLGGQASRFDLQLDPLGLGKVDVSVEIGADGRLAARLHFDNAQAASDLRGRAQDLRQALEQAGFSLGEGSLSFDFAGQNRDSGQSFDDSRRADQAGRAFARAMGALEDEAVLPVRFQTRRGLDLLI
ncbi:MAG: hypothetical protein GC145_04305 [Caulobacter sp.]|nr:hypothetical protein [Caulobacter sp.]